jgi:hypothetical protein
MFTWPHLLLYIPQQNYFKESFIFYEHLFPNITSGPYIKWCLCHYPTASLLLLVRNYCQVCWWGGVQWYKVQSKFCETQSTISKAEWRQHTHTHAHTRARAHTHTHTQRMVTHKHTLFSQDKEVSYTSSEWYSPGSRSRIMSRACR